MSVEIEPLDCGPLARKEFGVVFVAITNGNRQTYFTKGKAGEICPKLFEKKMIKGKEFDLCLSYQPENSHECELIKEFVISGEE